jgi:phosphohistidine swiveling domain-containing protein
MKLEKKDWILWGRWIQPTISGCFWAHWNEAEVLKDILPGTKLSPMLFLDGYTFLRAEDEEKGKEIISNLYNTNTFNVLHKRLEKFSMTCELGYVELLKKKDTINISDYVTELFAMYKELVGPWSIATILTPSLTASFVERGLIKSEEEMSLLIVPYLKTTWLEQQTIEVKSFARSLLYENPLLTPEDVTRNLFRKYPELEDKFQRHITQFEWYGTHHWVGYPYTADKAIEDVKSFLQKGAYENITPDIQKHDREHEDIWGLVASFVYWRTHMAEVSAKVVYHSRDILTRIADGWGMTYDDLTYLSSCEIILGINESLESITLPENFRERKNGYGCYIDGNNKEVVVTGEQLQKMVHQLVDVAPNDIKEFRGVTASKGAIVRGQVKVILSHQDAVKFKEDDILVVPETTPDFVPLMKKAKAIITETGGITSHAAIISRELKIPCIIGTKIATQVLHDGDLVEVDADNGVVRILKKY